ncbi:extracellular solute-binding protein [Plantactinospora soyae]|uniref:Aldouronate transport system substrate-binding protein n=1 Tax=Plantactinospora soyae TaxID=1544732 RepID=A0A927MEG6_9ACTN|nr:extracellular solute-binding protein [Plantactinospora soyae]MBE1492252.1 putative aldouronate transport system substrate-binding protein [Plantactinospora soyae]
MEPSGPGGATNRRNFLSLVGLGAAATAGGGLLAGCGGEVGPTSNAQDLDKLAGLLPNHKELALDIPKPSITGVRPVPDGYTEFPTSLVDAIADKPATSGQKITAMTPAWGPAPPGVGQSAYLAAVNAELGVEVNFSVQDGLLYANKLNAMLGARDVPDLLCVPEWEVSKLPRFSDAVAVLFEDLTDYLKGPAVDAYPMLATFPSGAWRNSFWNERLMAVPNPTDGPFPWALLYRKDLLDAAGLTYPKTIDELFEVGKAVTNPGKGVWAFNEIFAVVQMFYKAPGTDDGWRLKPDGTPEFKYETPEFRQAVEFMVKVFQAGLVHPDLVATKGADAKQLMAGGKIVFMQDGPGAWQGLQAEHQKTTPGFNVQAVPIFSATGGDPLVWGDDDPISFTFIKKGLGKARVEELLRVINWCSAPFGTKEFDLREYGVEGKHHTRTATGPVKTDLGFKEIQNQYFFISGRNPVLQPFPQTPNFVRDALTYSNDMVKFMEKDPWAGLKLEMPARFKASLTPTDEKIIDVMRGRRPLTDLDTIISEWRSGGGDEARDFRAKALADAGR